MASEKVVTAKVSWSLAPHTDTAKGHAVIAVPTRPGFNSTFRLTAHVHDMPPKYSFSVLLGTARVAGLDINPAGCHWNFVDGNREAVRISHWHCWPEKNVEPEERDLRFALWLKHFCNRFNVKIDKGCPPAPFLGGEQMRLL
jgi:hypothetical protein